jgi:hypothetical protein
MGIEHLLQRIMDSDENIRHCLAADADGNIISVNHREGVTNFLSEAETATSLKRASEAWKGRKELAPKIGKGLYAVAVFEKITRITFPLGDSNLLFVSLGSDKMRQDLHQGGVKQIVEHVLHILDGDPTTE